MIGHEVICTFWCITVQWHDGGETPAYSSMEKYVTTATDDGSDVFEVARKSCFPDAEEARRREFSLVSMRKVARPSGTALSRHGAAS